MKSFREYLNEGNLNEAKINTFKMGDWKGREPIENSPSKIRVKYLLILTQNW